MRRSVVLGTGGYLPERVVTNDDLSSTIETSDDWIVQRTGIRERHIAGEDEKTSDLATHAARAALEMAGLAPGDIDLIVLATATPDNTFPATATKLQQNLGCRGAAFDVQAVCSGFVYALSVADNMLRLNQAQRALVVGAEIFSRILDWEDRTTCVLFADGHHDVVGRHADFLAHAIDNANVRLMRHQPVYVFLFQSTVGKRRFDRLDHSDNGVPEHLASFHTQVPHRTAGAAGPAVHV